MTSLSVTAGTTFSYRRLTGTSVRNPLRDNARYGLSAYEKPGTRLFTLPYESVDSNHLKSAAL
jgi:hypothetical protein